MAGSPRPGHGAPVDTLPGGLRVATLNLWHDATAVEDRLDAAAVALTRAHVDAVALQEVRCEPGGSTAARLAARLGWPGLVEAATETSADGVPAGNAVLARFPLTDCWTTTLPGVDASGARRGAVAGAFTSPAGTRVLLVSAHLAWGGALEALRCTQLGALEAALVARGAPARHDAVVLGVDANAGPDADALRWLTGVGAPAGLPGTYWVDCWATADPDQPGATLEMANPWAATVAARHGIDPAWGPPARRQDYLCVRGWAWGRRGGPRGAARFGDTPAGAAGVLPSDHYGVVATLAG